MTKQEALNLIRKDGIYSQEVMDALQEPSGDVISRQAVQDYIAKYLSQYLYNDVREAVEVIDEYIGDLPPVNPQEPKTGHWKRISIDKYSEHAKYWYRCDRCGKDNLGNTDWCPNCGCRMVETQTESEVHKC